MRVLLVEDYGPLRRSIRKGLIERDFAVDVAEDGESGSAFLESSSYDLVILDLMLPKVPGLLVLERLRARDATTAVLILTARDSVEDRVLGLNRGADDYLTKPFAFEELLARVHAMVRRKYVSRSPRIKIADLEIDSHARLVSRAGQAIELTAREYGILEFLALSRGRVVTREEIWESVADFAAEASSNVVDVYVARLRRKLEFEGQPKLLHTRRGIGYSLGEPW